MKTALIKRVLSALLSALMVLLVIPFGMIGANAATTITSVDDMGKLGSGFNMLGDKYLGDAPMRSIFISTKGVTAQFDSSSRSTSSYSYITSVSDYFSNESKALNVGFGMGSEASAKLTIKFVELNLSQKFSLDVSSSSESSGSSYNSDSTEYMLLEYMHQIGTYTMWLDNERQIARLWQTDDDGNFVVLNEDFVYSLLNDDPEVFFKNYGSHLITRYTAGGTATSSYYGEIHYDSNESNHKENSSVSESAEGALKKYKEMESIYSSGSGSSNSNTVKRGESVSRGGSGNFAWDEASASAWAQTVNPENHIALVDDNLMMLPMWELLIDAGQIDRRIELEQYFNENVDSQYTELYGKYIYSPTGVKDFNGYTFVQTAEDFYNIRNDLDGNYVLLNNIDLSSYTEWEPIGSKNAPFTGIIDGNGNTVSGLNITKCASYAGLIGYNRGIIENLDVSGNIDADASGSKDNLAYIGGIAGYNGGRILNCRNNVTVNGKIMITDESDEIISELTDNFFIQNSQAIENAKSVAITQLTDNAVISVSFLPIRLTGTASGIAINISGTSENGPVYIVLENANITGAITYNGDRDVCIISVGDSNSINGAVSTTPIDLGENSRLFICGTAQLAINGGNGENGADGKAGSTGGTGENGLNQVAGTAGGTGGKGGDGAVGKDGVVAVNAKSMDISVSGNVTILGGDGGNGGNGGTGGTGGRGGHGYAGVIGSAGAGNGGTGGKGGAGGNGGNGAEPVADNVKINLYDGNLYLYNGAAGNGGNGGVGGKGGNGGNTTQWGAYCGWPGGGGSGGYGGNGGNTGLFAKYQYNEENISVLNAESIIYIFLGKDGDVGLGAHGGAVGSPGTAALDRPHHDNGTDRTSVYAENGSLGETVDYSVYETISVTTQYKVYRHFNNLLKFNEVQNLVSIGSAKEQALIEEMIENAGFEDENIWVGLEIIKVISGDFTNGEILLKWIDGTYIKILKVDGDVTEAYRVLLGDNKNVTEIIGEAYVNFLGKQPDNWDNNEFYIHLSVGAQWGDAQAEFTCGYITEENLASISNNSIKKNAILVGGICGYNAGQIQLAYNTAKVSADRGYSQNTGVSVYAGGISGYNSGTISDSLNDGNIKALAVSDSVSFFANAYAYNISAGENISNCVGNVKTVATAYSANALENSKNDMPNTASDEVKSKIEAYWKNSNLSINNVDRVEYLRSTQFQKDSLDLTIDGEDVDAITVRSNLYKSGIATVTVMYSDNENDYVRYVPVKVIDESPVVLEVYLMPETEFGLNEKFSFEGLALKLVFDNGTEMFLPSKAVTVSTPDMGVVGKQSVNVSYKYAEGAEFEYSYDINITAADILGISIDKLPKKLTYVQGEEINLEGLEVSAKLDNGESAKLSSEQLTVTYDFSEIGEAEVTLEYQGFDASFTCTVQASYILGDVNFDGEIDKKDYALLKRYCFDTVQFNDIQLLCADINGDGEIDKKDYGLLKRYCFGTYTID